MPDFSLRENKVGFFFCLNLHSRKLCERGEILHTRYDAVLQIETYYLNHIFVVSYI